MRIVTWEPKRFRFEYEQPHLVEGPRQWHLFHEDVRERVDARSYAEAAEYIKPDESPAWTALVSIYRDTRDGVVLLPWEPVKLTKQFLEAFGGDAFFDRLERRPRECKVWDLESGRVWCHLPGDTSRATGQSGVAPKAET